MARRSQFRLSRPPMRLDGRQRDTQTSTASARSSQSRRLAFNAGLRRNLARVSSSDSVRSTFGLYLLAFERQTEAIRQRQQPHFPRPPVRSSAFSTAPPGSKSLAVGPTLPSFPSSNPRRAGPSGQWPACPHGGSNRRLGWPGSTPVSSSRTNRWTGTSGTSLRTPAKDWFSNGPWSCLVRVLIGRPWHRPMVGARICCQVLTICHSSRPGFPLPSSSPTIPRLSCPVKYRSMHLPQHQSGSGKIVPRIFPPLCPPTTHAGFTNS